MDDFYSVQVFRNGNRTCVFTGTDPEIAWFAFRKYEKDNDYERVQMWCSFSDDAPQEWTLLHESMEEEDGDEA